MKNQMCLALIILAVLPAAAQKTASPHCAANAEAVTALTQDYAARVDGLLREVHAGLQSISEDLEAGRLTTEQAERLKLAVTRDMISRLDAVAAIYKAQLDLKDNVGAKSISGKESASDCDNMVHGHTNGTVSVEQLKREAAVALLTSRGKDVTP